ncbi:MAG: hypothetical protein O7C75_02625 [Verrucomicrobia bacterium]|nr:hypothetical protein [Verrucomicrobiota bacterium]
MTKSHPEKFMVRLSVGIGILLIVAILSPLQSATVVTSELPELTVTSTGNSDSFLAASLQSGLNPAREKSEALRSYGSYLSFIILGLVGCLLVFRGREIRRQHPKAFH